MEGKLFGLIINLTTKSLPLSGEETKERVNHKSCELFVISTIGRNLKNSELLKIFLDVSH
jgi:hypothetical protein